MERYVVIPASEDKSWFFDELPGFVVCDTQDLGSESYPWSKIYCKTKNLADRMARGLNSNIE
jgi:hypothetical protein